MELAKFIVEPSQDILQQMEQVLKSADNGYWWNEDIWKWDECPIAGAKRGGYIYFHKLPQGSIRTEFKFAIYQKILTKDWSLMTVFTNNNVFNSIFDSLAKVKSNHKSLLDKDYSYWETLYNTHLTQIGVNFTGKYK